MTASGNQICFFFIVNMKKLELEYQNKPRPKCTGEITTPNMFFPIEWMTSLIVGL